MPDDDRGAPQLVPRESPMGFAQFVREFNEGILDTEVGAAMQKLLAVLRDHSLQRSGTEVKGKLTIELNLAVEATKMDTATTSINFSVTHKEPKPVSRKHFFYLSKGCRLQQHDPRQVELPRVRELRPVDVRNTADPLPGEAT